MGNVINGVEEVMVAGLSLDKKTALSCSRKSFNLRDAFAASLSLFSQLLRPTFHFG